MDVRAKVAEPIPIHKQNKTIFKQVEYNIYYLQSTQRMLVDFEADILTCISASSLTIRIWEISYFLLFCVLYVRMYKWSKPDKINDKTKLYYDFIYLL